MAQKLHVRFGIATAPMNVDYQDLQRVWREADKFPRLSMRGSSTTACRSVATRLVATRTERSTKAGRCSRPWLRRPSAFGSACSSPVTASARPPCWPRSPPPSTSSRADGSTSGSAPARDRTTLWPDDRDRPRPRNRHPLNPPGCLLRAAQHRARGDRKGGRGGFHAHRFRLPSPWRPGIARWVADELIAPST